METMNSLSPQAVICEEVFDDSSHPSISEILDYAGKIGIDPEAEPQLLPLAEEGLMKPLPPSWKPCYDDKRKSYYYHNSITGRTQWEHPLDNIYRTLVVKARTESQSLSVGEPTEDATYTRDDLPSYEEPPPLPHFSKPSRHDIKLSPLKTRPLLGEIRHTFADIHAQKIDLGLIKQKSEERPLSSLSRHKNSISFDDTNFMLDKSASGDIKKTELTIVGGGSMFLKSNKKSPDLKPVESNRLRSILRDNGKSGDSESEKFDDDDKKSVRFNVEAKTDLFLFTDESENEGDAKKSKQKDIIDVIITSNKKGKQSRFTVFPVDENYGEGNNKNGSLKLIKPNPADFIKPDLENKDEAVTDLLFDSEDESVKLKRDKKLETVDILEEILSGSLKSASEIPDDKKDEESNEVQNNVAILDAQADFHKELDKRKEFVFESHKLELDRLLTEEKAKYETIIKEELEKLQKEMENRLKGTLVDEKQQLESKFELQKVEIQQLYDLNRKKFEESLDDSFEKRKSEVKKIHDERFALMEQDLVEKLEKSRDELIVSHNAILDQMKQNHAAVISELQKDFQVEEDIIRKERQKQILELRNKVARDVDVEKNKSRDNTDEERLFEKVRCEKRLLEDKYRCLKDKYLKLKTEVKLSIEKRNRKREQNLTTNTTTTTTTGSETEKSPSGKKDRTPAHSPSVNRRHSPKHLRTAHSDTNKHKSKADHKIRQILIQDQDTSASDRSYKYDDKFNRNDSQIEYDSSDVDVNQSGRSRKKIFSRLRGSSTTRLNNNNVKYRDAAPRSCSPVENLRKQLQKLEDLEDQFPQNAQSDTYHLRYPFSDGQKFEGSSELEFFRHRIHLERDSISRAKESLKQQKFNFKQRQNELKLKNGSSARNTLKQLYQEGKDLTDMEVSLHRTRSLLGEKVIRLRHLEQSLKRATLDSDEHRKEDATLSDLSSHSASSGISSTEFVGADPPALKSNQFKESSEIIQSLENLNSEIREIWEVLNKQQQASNIARVLPPLPLLYPDLGWPLLAGTVSVPPSIPTLADRLQNYRQHIALANAQTTMVTHDPQGATTTLVEKTKNLRQWLRQTTVDSNVESVVTEATL